jgi:hypothetical protein
MRDKFQAVEHNGSFQMGHPFVLRQNMADQMAQTGQVRDPQCVESFHQMLSEVDAILDAWKTTGDADYLLRVFSFRRLSTTAVFRWATPLFCARIWLIKWLRPGRSAESHPAMRGELSSDAQ